MFKRLLPLALLLAAGAPALAASPVPDEQIEAEAMGMDVARAKDGMFYVQAEINGQPVRFLVDTGANVVVLTGADAARLGIQAEVNPFGPRMQTAGGGAAMAWTKLAQVRLAGREVRDLKAAVVPTGLPVSLLGQNMLSKLGAVMIQGDRLSLR